MKTCSRCKVEKPLEDFHRRARAKDGRETYCKDCRQSVNKEARAVPKPTGHVCPRCQKPVMSNEKKKRVARTPTRVFYHHQSCWDEYIAYIERMDIPAPVEKPDTCPQGHLRTEENIETYVSKGITYKHCKDCRKDRARRKKAKTLGSVYW